MCPVRNLPAAMTGFGVASVLAEATIGTTINIPSTARFRLIPDFRILETVSRLAARWACGSNGEVRRRWVLADLALGGWRRQPCPRCFRPARWGFLRAGGLSGLAGDLRAAGGCPTDMYVLANPVQGKRPAGSGHRIDHVR